MENVAKNIAALDDIAIIGLGAILPDAPNVPCFWENIKNGKSSIIEVPRDRWKTEDYYDPDPKAPDKSYCKIGAFVRHFEFKSLEFRIPPKVSESIDEVQKWALLATREALKHAGYMDKPFARNKTAVILGNAMGGQNRLKTVRRIFYPEAEGVVRKTPEFQALSAEKQRQFLEHFQEIYKQQYLQINEDTMPGELSNVTSGRVANIFDLQGGNYTTDAACASSLAAIQSAVYGLKARDFDMVITGGSDHSMAPDSFVKFSKIGALSGQGSCPFDKNANGFVMGEGAAIFVLKRLEDAERDGDRVLAVIRGIGSSSDGKGKGITAPNVRGQIAAILRAYQTCGVSPADVGLIEAHGTSTTTGDKAEAEALKQVFTPYALPNASIAIGSVKSQIGHLKSAAGAAGLLKAVLSLHYKQLPPSINIKEVNPALGFANSPFFVNTRLQPWDKYPAGTRRAGVSAFGFGGANFHVVLEEYLPETKKMRQNANFTKVDRVKSSTKTSIPHEILVLGASDPRQLANQLHNAIKRGKHAKLPDRQVLEAPVRLAISYKTGEELAEKAQKLTKALESGQRKTLELLANQGVFLGKGRPGKIAFLFPGQGSQYLNMGNELRKHYPVVRQVFHQADRIMAPRLGKNLSDYLFVSGDSQTLAKAEQELKFTKITQPAVLTVNIAVCKLLEEFAIKPDMVIGHSLGEYGALVAAAVMSFEDSLIAASARAREMSDLEFSDTGKMASVFADYRLIEAKLAQIEGYAIAANINGPSQTVIAGETKAIEQAILEFQAMDIKVVELPVSHAFHTKIVAPAAPRLRKLLETMKINSPRLPIISNVNGRYYPDKGYVRDQILDLLEQQISAPVEYMKGIETLYQNGARIFVEVGPKRALSGLVRDILSDRPHFAFYTMHPKKDEKTQLNDLLASLYAQGVGIVDENSREPAEVWQEPTKAKREPAKAEQEEKCALPEKVATSPKKTETLPIGEITEQQRRYLALGESVGRFIEQMQSFQQPTQQPASVAAPQPKRLQAPVISGVSLGLPGKNRDLFDEDNFDAILAGENFIDSLSLEDRQKMADKNITRLIKRSDAAPTLEMVTSPEQMIHLAGVSGHFDLEREFAVPVELQDAMDCTTQMAIAAGILALRDAGIPLVLRYKKTSIGGELPSHWALHREMADETGVICASAFAGTNRLLSEVTSALKAHGQKKTMEHLEDIWREIPKELRDTEAGAKMQKWMEELKQGDPYHFHRKFLMRVLPMGASQLAQFIGARGPNTHINSACASTSVALGIARDWIQVGRCRRVLIVAADDPTSDVLREWILSGFLALGAATSEKKVELAALPFDRRRHGMIVGMGAVGMVLEHPQETSARGMRGIAEFLGIDYGNSAFHASRLDVEHIKGAMERFMARMENEYGLNRHRLANEAMFMSHETYTPARGGSAAAEVESLKAIFGQKAKEIVVANTKGFTGHAMAAGIEEAVTIKALQRQKLPPVANFREPDPQLGSIRLSQGGSYPLRYAIKFSAGFGSQMAVSLWRRVDNCQTPIADEHKYAKWLKTISGQENPKLEVVDRALRIQNDRQAPRPVSKETSMPPIAEKNSIADKVLKMVAEITGYPIDMLELDLDLEADLGIDTIKQAEVFAEIRESYGLPRDENLQLRDYPSLQHLIDYVESKRPDLQTSTSETPKATTELSSTEDKITGEIIAIVAEKTGYPADMLELDLDLEADLGIDTVKQAEVFAEIRESYGLPRENELQLRDYPTLQHLIGYVKQHDVAKRQKRVLRKEKADKPKDAKIERLVAEIIATPCKEKHDISFAGKTVLIVADKNEVWKCVARQMIAKGVRVVIIAEENLSLEGAKLYCANLADDAALGTALERVREENGSIWGVLYLLGLDDEPDMKQFKLEQWKLETKRRVKSLFAIAKQMQRDLNSQAQSFLISATSTGGSFGLEDFSAKTPISGGIFGLTKALGKEMPNVLVKICDFPADMRGEKVATLLLEEISGDHSVEVSFANQERHTVQLVSRPLCPKGHPRDLGPEPVFVISGGARGITAEIACDLAQNFQAKMVLLGTTAIPKNIEQLADMDDQKLNEFKQKLRLDLAQKHARVTPVILDREFARFRSAISIHKNIARLRQLGAVVEYCVCDVTEEKVVEKIVAEVAAKYGKIDVLIHGAGIEESKSLADKKIEEFTRIFDVKVDGCFNLVQATKKYGLKFAVLFSSVAGRFGNIGQSDYCAANDLLNKYAVWIENYLSTKAVSIDWTAWAEVGMATKGTTKNIFEQAGITMIPLKTGVPMVREEISFSREAEIVIAGNLGFLDAHKQIVLPEKSRDAIFAQKQITNRPEAFCMLDCVLSHCSQRFLSANRKLDPKRDLYLGDHAVDGTPLLPGVMGLEAMCQAAKLFCPDGEIVALKQVQFAKALKIFDNHPVDFRVHIEKMPGSQELVARLESDFVSASGEKLGDTRLHFQATIILGQRQIPQAKFSPVKLKQERTLSRDKIYRLLFHGPLFQVCDTFSYGQKGAFAKMNIDDNAYIKEINPIWQIDPLAIELGFQCAGLYEYQQEQRFGLPHRIDEIRFYRLTSKEEIQAFTTPLEKDANAFCVQISSGDTLYMEIDGYRTISKAQVSTTLD